MRRILVVSTPAILEARNLAAWITRERIPGVRIAPSRGEWGVFAPASHAGRARRAFRKVVAANNPGGYCVVFKIRPTDPYTTMKKRCRFGRCVQIVDMLVKGIVSKAAVLDPKGKVRFVAFKKAGRTASNPGMDALADAAVMMAARGARQYLDVHKLTADPAALTACLKSWVKIKFPEALRDAKDAISAGMHSVAEQTFAATMRLAGIEAAKEAARAPGTNSRRNPYNLRYYQDTSGRFRSWKTGVLVTPPKTRVRVMSYRTRPAALFETWIARGERHWKVVRLGSSNSNSGRRKRRKVAELDKPWCAVCGESERKAGPYRRPRHGRLAGRLLCRACLRRAKVRRNAPSYSRRNASIESQWPSMREAQRVSALRIVGIDRDVADLWAYRSWNQLSSVVKILLARSWRHGGDTTRIRRVPVGAR